MQTGFGIHDAIVRIRSSSAQYRGWALVVLLKCNELLTHDTSTPSI